MQVLVHIGLNKCASTYVQAALAAARAGLRAQGVYYDVTDGRFAHYTVSDHYGFGSGKVVRKPMSLSALVRQAEDHGCGRIIISSEHFSRPRRPAIAAFRDDLEKLAVEARFLFFSREPVSWARSLFNQHVKTMDDGPYFSSINSFIDHALQRGIMDIAKRYRAWAEAFGDARVEHYHIAEGRSPGDVLLPFADFAGLDLQPAPNADHNHSLSPGALYLSGLVRRAPPLPGRSRVLASIAASDCSWVPVPPDYFEIDAERMARLEEQVIAPFAALPRAELPTRRAA